MDVGIRELKAHLSSYVKRAAQGETIRVTDRGQVTAVLGPPPSEVELPEALARGIRDGWITAAGASGPLTSPYPSASLPEGQSTLQIIQDDRDDN